MRELEKAFKNIRKSLPQTNQTAQEKPKTSQAFQVISNVFANASPEMK